ncbi:hypothetical protein Ptr86124_012381 [Pyrenophora tritici-repentis]|uniref:Uncharacterized protein n=1 Tax=Pyrenophora tritici-repentis TaxID=45151 RepID=A0A922SVY0_9PLEO|nr:hypothetical protein Ptr86124_012381 [Pyrenophora tritici-repentis]
MLPPLPITVLETVLWEILQISRVGWFPSHPLLLRFLWLRIFNIIATLRETCSLSRLPTSQFYLVERVFLYYFIYIFRGGDGSVC